MTDLPLKERLLRGAKMLGELWRADPAGRCQGGWSLECPCPKDVTRKFCRGKALWVSLAIEDGRVIGDGPMAVIEAMWANPVELQATGMTVTIDVPELGPIKIGPKGEIPFATVIGADILAIKTVVQVIRNFPGSKVVQEA